MAQINKPNTYFNSVLYTGNGTNPRSITGVGFQPDLIWVKERSSTSEHQLVDNIRGAYHRLQTSTTLAESNDSSPYADFQSFDSDGWTMGNGGAINENTQTYVGWNWLASNTTSANTDGSISSTVSVNTTSGFSIVSYTGNSTSGATIGHGLGVAPKVIITKARTNAGRYWGMYHSSLGNTGSMALNSTNAFDVSSTYWNNTNPSSTVFTVGTNGDTNSSSGMIAYCFAEKKGFSKFGSYTGNGSTDGTFVYTGFKPAMIIIKRTDTSGNGWQIFDNKRDIDNPIEARLEADSSGAEYTLKDWCDLTSNGFKWRETDSGVNFSGSTYIYMCFAENPLVGTNNIPATAR